MKSNLLRVSFNFKLKFEDLVDSNPELIECLKEDMDNHLSNLRADYEEKLDFEIRKIKKKHQIK